MIAAALLLTGFSATLGTVQAKEENLASRGSLVYEDDRGKTEWYAEDLLWISEKLSSIPEQCYDPARYTHEHDWVYRDINDKTHTRHCDGCGAAYDITNTHKAVREERCVIAHGEGSYSGRNYICECGWQWMRENGHTLLFEAVDAVSHTSRCALDGTAYCQGYEPVTEEHYAYYYVPGEDGMHHEKVCLDCGWREEEMCCFSQENPEGEEAEADETLRWCVCGNKEKQKDTSEEDPSEENTAPPSLGEAPEMPVEEEPKLPAEDAEGPVEEIPKTPEDRDIFEIYNITGNREEKNDEKKMDLYDNSDAAPAGERLDGGGSGGDDLRHPERTALTGSDPLSGWRGNSSH